MSIVENVKSDLGFTWKHGVALILGGFVAISLARRNTLGIAGAVDSVIGMVTAPLSNFRIGG